MCCSGIGKSTRMGSSACSETSAMPADTYWPFSTLRMPTRPRERAPAMRLLGDHGLDALDGGLAVSRLARAVSRFASEVTLFCIRSAWRWIGDLGLPQRRLGAGEVGELDRDVELHQLGALRRPPAALDQDLGDDAGDLARDVDALRGDQRADRGQLLDPFVGARRLGRHRRRRRRHLRQERAGSSAA